LLVEASRARGVWVLPKGHIERGETAEAAAVREVEEEGGVHAEIISEAGDSEYIAAGKQVRTIFYVMRYVSDTRSDEVRGRAWHQYEDAHRILQFDNLRRVLAHAHALAGNSDPDRTA
jgi:8-oxo-dGTP pyrophosphatase MutT (NUDIX family)